MVGVYPADKKILQIWSYVWIVILALGAGLIGAINGYSGDVIASGNDWKITEWKGAGNLGLAAGIFMVLAASVWDIILFAARAAVPLGRIHKSVVTEEKIGVLFRAKAAVAWVILLAVFNIILGGFALIVFLIKKETTYIGVTLKNAISSIVNIEGSEQHIMLGISGLLCLIGLLSTYCKFVFSSKWQHCLYSYPNRHMGHLACSRPGVTTLFYCHNFFWMAVITAGICFLSVCEAAGTQGTWLKPLKAGGQKFEWQCEMYQIVLGGLFLLGALIVCCMCSHKIKNKRDFTYAMMRRNMLAQEIKNLHDIKNRVDVLDYFHAWLILLWGFASICALLTNEMTKVVWSQLSMEDTQGKWILAALLAVFFLSLFPFFCVQISIRGHLNKASAVDAREDRRLMKMNRSCSSTIS